ncbi:hypothetical protein ACHQM5_016368 [Ranunculus cassubicifolius]
MEKLCKELDEVKQAMERLRAENLAKTELSETLRKAHNDQLKRIRDAHLQIEKQTLDLNNKAEEISLLKKLEEQSKSNLQEKESALKQLRSLHDKLRADNQDKLQTLEARNGELIFALEEANTRIQTQDQKIQAFAEEVVRMKDHLSVSQKKAAAAEQKIQAIKDMRLQDDQLMNLEEEGKKIKDQLKWKKEQFNHLQQAHEKVQDQFRTSKKEWEQERSTLIDEISLLQTKLDSQTRISESLQHKLQICNQALAHEESRRKVLEIQLSESKACYENVFVEFQEAKTKIDSLSNRRDEDIADLRNLLSTKDTLFKEAEYRREYLEQENKELQKSLKEFREAQIKEAGSVTSLTKVRNKLRALEQVHRECSAKLKARESEWASQMETLVGDLSNCRSVLDCKDKQIQELQMEVENFNTLVMQLKGQNEEMHVMLTVYKSQLSDVELNFSTPGVEMELRNEETEKKIALLIEQLDQKSDYLAKAREKIEQEHEIATSLSEKIGLLEKKYLLAVEESVRYKEMLEESSVQQLLVREQAFKTEKALKENLRKVSDALDQVNYELAEKAKEDNGIKLELDRWKSAAERLQTRLDEVSAEKIGPLEQKYFSVLKELEDYKELLEESSVQQLQLKEQALETAYSMKEDLRKVSDAFDRVSSELAEKIQEESRMVTELDRWKSSAEHLQCSLDEALIGKIGPLEQKYLLTLKELESCKERLEDSSAQQVRLQEHALQTLTELESCKERLENSSAQQVQLREQALQTLTELESCKERLQDSSAQQVQLQEQALQTLTELESCKERLEDSSAQQVRLREQALQTENGFKDELREISDAFDKAKSELAEKIKEESRIITELNGWKSTAEHLQRRLDEVLAEKNGVLEQNYLLTLYELENYKKQLEDSSAQQLRLKEQALQTENALKEELNEVSDAFEKINSELAERIQEEGEIEFELDRWKAAAEHLQRCLDENLEFRREMEGSLLAQVETEQNLKVDNNRLLLLIEEKEKRVGSLQQKIDWMEQEFMRRELDAMRRELEAAIIVQIRTEKSFEQEKETLLRAMEEKERTIENLQLQIMEYDLTWSIKLSTLAELNENELRTLVNLVEELESDKTALSLEIAKLSSDKGDLLAMVEEFGERIDNFCNEDVELMGRLGSIMENLKSDDEHVLGLNSGIEVYCNRKDENSPLSCSGKNTTLVSDRRSPLIERNT